MNDEEIIEHINNEIFKNEINKEKKAKPHIFNNKKNNNECSNLLRLAINTEKELLVMPYPKEKQKKNKTLNEIGIANGIYYPTTNIIKGILSEKDNYKVIIRGEDENKYNAKKNNITSKNNIYIKNAKHKNYFLDMLIVCIFFLC